MNIKKNSLIMLSLVFGVSVILYIFDVPILPSSTVIVPTVYLPVSPFISSTIAPTPISRITNGKRNISDTVEYQVKSFKETIMVGVTLDNNIVTELTIDHSPKEGKSKQYHDAFDGEIRPLVIGKNINSINVSRVAGSSDTTTGFMQAIEKIKTQI